MRLALGVLVAAGAFAMARRRPSGRYPPQSRDGSGRYASATEHGREPPMHEQPSRALQRSFDLRCSAPDSDHLRAERRFQTLGLIIDASAAGATALAAWFAYGAFTQAQRQADTAQEALIAADRPWIKVAKLPRVRLDVDDRVVWVRTDLEVKNIGRSPAQHTFLDTTLLPDASLDEQSAEAENLCRKSAVKGYPVDERLVFPDDGHVLWTVTGLGTEAIREKRDRRLRWEADVSRQIFGGDAVENRMKEQMALPLRTGFTLVGCITYAVSTRQVIGQTAFIYGIDRACGLGPLGICTFDIAPPATYAENDIVVREPVGGAFAR